MATSTGYQHLSSFMAQEQRYGLFREFQELAYEDLLYRQSELAHLEKDLQVIVKHDRENGRDNEEKLYSLDWRRLSTSSQRGSQSKHWSKRLEVRTKLREYYDTLLQYKQVFTQSHPAQKEIDLLRSWIMRPDLGGGCGFIGRDLGPLESTVYDEKFQGDLMVLVDRSGENDFLTRLVAGPILDAFDWVIHRFKARERDIEHQAAYNPGNLRRYSDSHILWAVEFFGTVLASIAPMSSIIALYFIEDMSARLASVCVFTILFAAIVKLATRARRVEVFAVTAAFCSVQVVFVGSTTAYKNLNERDK